MKSIASVLSIIALGFGLLNLLTRGWQESTRPRSAPTGNVQPGRGLFKIEPQTLFRWNTYEIIQGIPAGGMDSPPLRGSRSVQHQSCVARSQHNQR